MPIKDLQQQQAQVGRIRIGHQVPMGNGRSRPEKLDRFRFTTPSQALAEAVAEKYGGKAEEWAPDGQPKQFEVVSDTRALPVLVPPRPVTQWYELWSGSGCQRRCDGETETISGEACKCPLDPIARADAAGKGNACKATTRLKVMLPEIPGLGVWRLDSHGFYSAIELPQTAEFLGAVTDSGGYVRATLTIEARTVKRPGQGVRSFYVPALHVDVTPEQLLAGAGHVLPGRAAEALANGDRKELTAGEPEGAKERAQELARMALDATTAEEVRGIFRTASAESLLDVDVADDNDVVVQLRLLFIARGEALATPEKPATDVDELWQQVITAAADQPPPFSVDADYADWSGGKTPAEATVEDLTNYLERLRSMVPAGS